MAIPLARTQWSQFSGLVGKDSRICRFVGTWRGSLLPLGREAAPKASASQPSGSKLPRHPSTLFQTL
nr:hypothetical protein C1892_23175 [Pseudomonas sp. MPBD7-1]